MLGFCYREFDMLPSRTSRSEPQALVANLSHLSHRFGTNWIQTKLKAAQAVLEPVVASSVFEQLESFVFAA